VLARLRTAGLLALLAAAASGGGTALYYEWFPPGRSLPGTTVDGRVPGRSESLGDFLERRRGALLDREVILELPEGYRVVTLGELGVELDVADTLRRTLEPAQTGTIFARIAHAWAAREGRSDVPLSFQVDARRAEATLTRVAPEVLRAPTDARLDLDAHRRVPAVPGVELDVAGTVARIRAGGRDEGALIRVATRPVQAAVTEAMLLGVDVSRVLSSQETTFNGSERGRVTNIRVAASHLDGKVIAPGQTLSFNDTVGPRRLEFGFTWAPEIIDDELQPGVGGGTCQVASTLHGAAVLGALDVVQRRSHSRPSSYTKLGLDATVIYGEVDLKIRNPYDSPLIIHAYTPTDRSLRVELLGREPPGKIEYSYGVSKRYDFYRRVTTKPFLEPGRRIKKQKGIFGYDVVSIIKVVHPDGTSLVKFYRSEYRPTPEVFWVGPGFDVATLPELPEGATRVEVDGKTEATIAPEDDNPYAQGG
jgi:vancomycin resistance protein YoaR